MSRPLPAELFLRNAEKLVELARVIGDVEVVVEPAFIISGHKALYLNVANWSDKARDYLAHHVARVPNDLRVHVQRINVNRVYDDIDGTYGAVLDLFIALGKEGLTLRKRVLRQCAAVLRPETLQVLEQHLIGGITAMTPMPAAPRSVLTKGLVGNSGLVENVLIRKMRQQDWP